MSESLEQIKFVCWLRKNFPDYRVFAIPNGNYRNPSSASTLKNEGVSPGVPDLMIPRLKMFIEMKTIGGRVSPKQRDWLDYLSALDYKTAVCYCFEEAQAAFYHAKKTLEGF